MTQSIRTGSRLALAVALALSSQGAYALGLGNATVDSYLNQPLQANINLITSASDDLDSVTAKLASADDFALIGASREAISVPLRFEVVRSADGADIRVTSNLAVKDPVIRLIVEVNWSSGRMLREYTLFLDPPVFDSPAPAPVVDQRRTAPAESRSAPQPEAVTPDDATEQGRASTPPAAARPAASTVADGEYGPVQAGETLWRIAHNWSQSSGLNTNSAMLAIQRNNPQAFINNNINLLKRGAILRMPTVAEVEAISAAAARDEVISQTESLSQQAASPAVSPAVETPLVDEASSLPEARPEADYAADDQLELVPPSADIDADSAYGFEASASDSEASTGLTALREELARKEEELISEQQENTYLQDRIKELEAQLAASQPADSSATVEDAELAVLEQNLRESRLQDATGEAGTDADAAEAGDAAASSADGLAAPAGNPPAASAPASQPQVPVVSSKVQEPDSPWYSSWTIWLIGLVLLVAGIAGWLMSRRDASRLLIADGGPEPDARVREMTDEAEEILKVLKPETETAGEEHKDTAGDAGAAAPVSRKQQDEDAELLDEDSADPEVRLDLARAYISMGDKEAARVILDEVIEHGSEEQQAEARGMLEEL